MPKPRRAVKVSPSIPSSKASSKDSNETKSTFLEVPKLSNKPKLGQDDKLTRLVNERGEKVESVSVSAASKVVILNDGERWQEGDRCGSSAKLMHDDEQDDHMRGAEFAEDELRGLRSAFRIFEKTPEGGITAEELHQVLTDLGETITEEECRKMVSAIDDDGNGCIDVKEFVDLILTFITLDDTESDVIEAFKVFDRAQTGFISSKELRRVMMEFGDKLSEQEMEEMIKVSDFDMEGQVNYEEFTRVMMKSIRCS